jgi:hypothetical protein
MSLRPYLSGVRQRYEEIDRQVINSIKPRVDESSDEEGELKGGAGIGAMPVDVFAMYETLPIKMIGDLVVYDPKVYDIEDDLVGGTKPKFYRSGADTCVYKPYISSLNWLKNPPIDGNEYVSRVVALDTDELESTFYLNYLIKQYPILKNTLNPPYSVDKGVVLEGSVMVNGVSPYAHLNLISQAEWEKCALNNPMPFKANPSECYNLITKTQGPTFWQVASPQGDLATARRRIYDVILNQFIPALVILNTNGLVHNDLHWSNVSFWKDDYKTSPGVIFDFGRAIFNYKDFVSNARLYSDNKYIEAMLKGTLSDRYKTILFNLGMPDGQNSANFVMQSAISLFDSLNFAVYFDELYNTPNYKVKEVEALKLLSNGLEECLLITDWKSRVNLYTRIAQDFFKTVCTPTYTMTPPPASPQAPPAPIDLRSPTPPPPKMTAKAPTSAVSSIAKASNPFQIKQGDELQAFASPSTGEALSGGPKKRVRLNVS